jgi:hypothetical protein
LPTLAVAGSHVNASDTIEDTNEENLAESRRIVVGTQGHGHVSQSLSDVQMVDVSDNCNGPRSDMSMADVSDNCNGPSSDMSMADVSDNCNGPLSDIIMPDAARSTPGILNSYMTDSTMQDASRTLSLHSVEMLNASLSEITDESSIDILQIIELNAECCQKSIDSEEFERVESPIEQESSETDVPAIRNALVNAVSPISFDGSDSSIDLSASSFSMFANGMEEVMHSTPQAARHSVMSPSVSRYFETPIMKLWRKSPICMRQSLRSIDVERPSFIQRLLDIHSEDQEMVPTVCLRDIDNDPIEYEYESVSMDRIPSISKAISQNCVHTVTDDDEAAELLNQPCICSDGTVCLDLCKSLFTICPCTGPCGLDCSFWVESQQHNEPDSVARHQPEEDYDDDYDEDYYNEDFENDDDDDDDDVLEHGHDHDIENPAATRFSSSPPSELLEEIEFDPPNISDDDIIPGSFPTAAYLERPRQR